MAAKYSVNHQVEALNRHDAEAFSSFYMPDALVDDPQYPEPLQGRDAIRRDIADFVKAFPDLIFTVTTVVERGETVAFEGVGRGTHKGPIAGPSGELPATNRPVKIRFAAFLRLNDQGLIAEERRYFDIAGMMQQLGATA